MGKDETCHPYSMHTSMHIQLLLSIVGTNQRNSGTLQYYNCLTMMLGNLPIKIAIT